ncbi:hypothetical protein HNR42_000150 [Deinobacterium chartae]|uniref:Uncharacterized protein n=1 Tax=Deinobacterium chartae TaxID=521158 RepID=A0A841HXT9_9DEIO|nr:hypothetical protein [Deinobacterium chartae]MBB6096738.1 hypothetical protein [Deinobacterium chartae]
MNQKTLGIIALVCSPAMLIEGLRHNLKPVPNELTDPTGALLYAAFSIGWLCSMIGLRRLRAAGDGQAGRYLLDLTLASITLAILQTPMDLLKLPTSHPLYLVTDLAWPASMLLTFVVSVAALFARALPGWTRFVPMLCGISVPLTLLLTLLLGRELPGLLMLLHTAVAWALLGWVVYRSNPQGPAPLRPQLAA